MLKLIPILFCFFSISLQAQQKKMLWFDAHANFQRLSSIDSLAHYLQLTKNAGITDVIIDIKPITGEVLYHSNIAPFCSNWKGFEYPKDFDLLQTTIELGHRAGLTVHAAINVFSGGHNHFNRGIIYNDHAHWQSIQYLDTGFTPISKIKTKYSGMLNPAHPEVQQYELSILNEVLQKYPALDGIILDRVRYDGIEADFSPLSKKLFEKYIGQKNIQFPSDIFSYKKENGKSIKVPGPYYQLWLEWRASVIHQFFEKARAVAKKANPRIIFGDYTGAWYATYYEVGANWASNQYNAAKTYSWATEKYQQYGYAELLDLYITGCYFYEVTKDEVAQQKPSKTIGAEAGMRALKDSSYSVEGAADIAMHITKKAAPVIGSIYVEQYQQDEIQFTKAMQMCLDKTNGLMIFDLVHIVEKNWWNAIAAVCNK